MAATPTPDQEQAPSAEDQLRQKLLGRIAVAAIVIVGLLGSLAMFDAIYGPEAPTKVASAPPLPAPPAVTQAPAASPATPAAEPAATPEAAKPEGGAAADAKPAVPVPPLVDSAPSKLAAATPSPSTPSAAPAAPEGSRSSGAPPLTPLPAEKPLTKPASPRQATIRPSEPAAQAAAPATRPDPQREIARAPWNGNRSAPASRPLSQPVQTASRQFALQLGVFNNLANAEDLRAKLELHGIPSTIEARVQVGPFKTREEIEAAREKLKALGMDTGIMISLRK